MERKRLATTRIFNAPALLLALLFLATPLQAREGFVSYPGAVHVHTRYSDGSGDVAEVVRAATGAGLRYLIVTDHNTLQPLLDGHEGYHEKLLVLVGVEVTTDAGHLLALDVPRNFALDSSDAPTVLQRIRSAGGISFLAHPFASSWRWKEAGTTGFTGFEVINLAALVDDDLRSAMHPRAPRRSFGRLAQRVRSYLSRPAKLLRQWTGNPVLTERGQWDRWLAEGRQVVGIASVDAHARVEVGNRTFKIPTYREAFDSVQTYAVVPRRLRGELAHDRKLIVDAYRNGRLYTVYPRVSPAPGFRFTAREGPREATMGQPIRLENGVRLRVEAPDFPRPTIRLIREGREVAVKEGSVLEWTATQPGAYRAEVYARQGGRSSPRLRKNLRKTAESLLRKRPEELRPWVFSNPIYVRREAP